MFSLSHRRKLAGCSADIPRYSSMWKTLTRLQSMSRSPVSARTKGSCELPVARITEAWPFSASTFANTSAKRWAAARPSSSESSAMVIGRPCMVWWRSMEFSSSVLVCTDIGGANELRRTDVAKRHHQDDQRRQHVDDRHRADCLARSDAGGECRIVERHHKSLIAGRRHQEREFEQRHGLHKDQQGCG